MTIQDTAPTEAKVPAELITDRPPPIPAPTPKKVHVTGLDGLRGLACLTVVVGHGWVDAGYYPLPKLHVAGVPLTDGLFFDKLNIGVDLFFALSGCCLALPLFLSRDKPWDWSRYIYRRAWRILPPFWICVTLFFLLHLLIERVPIEPLAGQMLEVPSLRQLFYTYTLVSTCLSMTFWTLPVEWRWYFVLPVLMIVWRRFGGAVAAGGCALVAVAGCAAWAFGPKQLIFVLSPLPILVPMFAAGVWAADICSGRPLNRLEAFLVRHCAAGLALGVLLWLGWPKLVLAPWEEWLVRVITRTPVAFFAVLAAVRSPSVARALSIRPLVFVGLFSYSLYLVHTPIIQAAHHLSGSDAWSTARKLAFFQGPVLALTLVAGYLFYLVAERPFMRRKPA